MKITSKRNGRTRTITPDVWEAMQNNGMANAWTPTIEKVVPKQPVPAVTTQFMGTPVVEEKPKRTRRPRIAVDDTMPNENVQAETPPDETGETQTQ